MQSKRHKAKTGLRSIFCGFPQTEVRGREGGSLPGREYCARGSDGLKVEHLAHEPHYKLSIQHKIYKADAR